MPKLNEIVEYVSIYFVTGDAPKEWGRNAIKDPAAGGWSNAFIIRKEGFQPKIFVPYTVQAWSVPPDCYELARVRDVIKPLDSVWMKDCIERNYINRQGLGIPMDKEAAGLVIEALGFELPDMFKTEEAEKPAKERKVKPKSAVREARAGLISIATISDELKLLPRIARGFLRDANIQKPDIGWCGDNDWAETIRAVLRKAIEAKSSVEKKGGDKPKVQAKDAVRKVPDKPSKKVSKVKPKPVPVEKGKVQSKKGQPKILDKARGHSDTKKMSGVRNAAKAPVKKKKGG